MAEGNEPRPYADTFEFAILPGNTSTFTFNVPYKQGSFRGGLVATIRPENPSLYIIGVGGGQTESRVGAYRVYGNNDSPAISSVSLTNGILTINYNGEVAGGARMIWFN